MGPSSTGVERNLPMTLNLKGDRLFAGVGSLVLQQLGAIAPGKNRINGGAKSFIYNAFEMKHGIMSLVLTFGRQVI